MKLLQIYNQYRSLFNGEEMVVNQTAQLIEKGGGQASLLMRSSRDIQTGLSGKMSAFWNGIYSRDAYKEMQRVLQEERPDIVHVHNLYPLFSPSILVACRRAGVPVVMSVHNQQLTCPTSDHLNRGEVCERCIGGREYNCVLQNCRSNIFESIGYATRSVFARKRRLFHDNVTLFIALAEFAKKRIVESGFDENRVVVLPNMAPDVETPTDPAQGEYVAFAGRMSPEKGIDTLLDAAASLPNCPVHLAGNGPTFEQMKSAAPENAKMLGGLGGAEMERFYQGARLLVLPSRTYEMCPLVVLEAMSHGLPVITSRIGGQAELVEDGVTGLLFDPGDSRDLAAKVKRLWEDPELCQRMGRAGYERAQENHREEVYYKRLIDIYERAATIVGRSLTLTPTLDKSQPETRQVVSLSQTRVPEPSVPTPDVAVLMTVYNGMPYLKASIESVLDQTLRNFRFIIVNDGSTDGTAEFLEGLTDPRIRILHQENQGTAAAANYGLQYCDAEFTARMDADDIALPTRLEQQLSFLRGHTNVGLVGTQVAPMGATRVGMGLHLPLTHDDIVSAMLKGRHGLAHSSIMFRTALLKQLGGYWDQRLIDDWDMMLRMAEVAEIANLDEVLHHYRIHRGSLNGENMRRMRLHIAYACECARRRRCELEPVTYEQFQLQLRQRPYWRRTMDEFLAYSLNQYRVATAEILGGQQLSGYWRLAWSAACFPPLAIRRIKRMI